MKKQKYISPAIQVMNIEAPRLLTGSEGGGEKRDNYDDYGPGAVTNDPRYPGQGL